MLAESFRLSHRIIMSPLIKALCLATYPLWRQDRLLGRIYVVVNPLLEQVPRVVNPSTGVVYAFSRRYDVTPIASTNREGLSTATFD